MASQREYEMQFRLNAQLGSQYNATFKAAQSALQQYRAEYNTLAKAQNDISAYQRQQSAVENTKSKLEMLQQQYDNIQQEINETGSYSSDLENKLLAKRQQIEKTTQALQQQVAKMEAYRASLAAAGVNTDDLDGETARLRTQLEQLRREYDAAGNAAEDFGDEGKSSAEIVGEALAAVGIAKALHEIYDAYAECVAISAGFEEAMSNVEALSGASASELAQLTDMAQELGATTKFTAKESADAMGYMAMAGWDAQAMLQGMDGVLQLAAASGEDLATVSDIVTDNLTAFGLKASDTAHFSDVLAAAATKSNTSVSIMGETFKQSASIAGALGYSVDDVAVAIGLMANSGIKGSLAGTALKNTFNGLLEGVTLTGAAFGDYEFSALRADGTMKSFGDTMMELRDVFNQMTEAERVNNAMAIAGSRSYNGLLAIINATDADYANLTASIQNCTGAAKQMANIKLDNMNGQLTLAKSAWDAVEMSIGDALLPTMTDLYGVAASVFGDLAEFIRNNPALVKAITAGAIGVGTFTVALTGYIVIAKLAKVATEALNSAIAANPYLLAGAAVIALIAGLAALTAMEDDVIDKDNTLLQSSEAQRAELERLNSEYEEACELYGQNSEQARALRGDIEVLTMAFDESRMTIAEWESAVDADINAHKEIMQAYEGTTAQINEESEGVEGLISKLIVLSSKTDKTAADMELIAAIVAKLNGEIPGLGLSFDSATGAINLSADALHAYAQRSAEASKYAANMETYTALVAEETALYNDMTTAQNEAAAAQERYNAAKAEMDQYDPNFMPANVNKEFEDAYFNLKYWNDEVDRTTEAYNENSEMQAKLTEEMGLYVDEVQSGADASDDFNRVLDGVNSRITELATAYTEAYEAAYESINGQYQLWEKADTVTATSVSSMNANLDSQIQYWQDYNSNIASLSERTGDIEGLSDMIASFADGSNDSVNAIAGMAEASDEDLQAMVAKWQELQAQQESTSSSLADLQTEFSTQMDLIAQQMEADVEAMDLSDDAKNAAMVTIQGFIDGATSMLPSVRSAYTRIANAARAALDISPSGGTIGGYATGTTYAPPGAAWVGENGPELLWFRGGEAVMTAEESASYMRQATETEPVDVAPMQGGDTEVTVSFAPVYHIDGNSSPEDVRAILAEHDEELLEQFMSMLHDNASNAARRAYV